jgi:outer membrane protein OmpA-like peptidoglycan-associated protein
MPSRTFMRMAERFHDEAQLGDAEVGLPLVAPPKWTRRKWSGAVPIAAVALGFGTLAIQYATRSDDNLPSEKTVGTFVSTSTATTAIAVAPSKAPSTSLAPVTTLAPATTAPPTTAPVLKTVAPPVTAVAPATTAPATSAPAPATTVAATAVPTPPATTAPAALSIPGPTISPTRWAVFSGGVVYLRGVVPDDAVAAIIAGKAAQVVGAANVVDEYTRVPGTPVAKSAPLFVSDMVLFGEDNAQIQPQFEQLLNLGVGLLKTFPTVTVTVRGHTDSVGSLDYNMKLAQRRVDAVIDYAVKHGSDRGRLVGEAIGPAEPVGDNTTRDGRQLNRRIEFVIDGLFEA